MDYEVEVLKRNEISEFEGHIIIRINEIELMVAYQASCDFANKYIELHKKLLVDLWLVYGKANRITNPLKALPTNLKVAGGTIKGEVKKILSPHEFRVDCGLLIIDVDNEEPNAEICENDYIEIEGTYQIYFPKTNWARS